MEQIKHYKQDIQTFLDFLQAYLENSKTAKDTNIEIKQAIEKGQLDKKELLAVILQGYQLMMEIRKFFTGQDLQYRIAWKTKEGDLYEATLNEKALFKNFHFALSVGEERIRVNFQQTQTYFTDIAKRESIDKKKYEQIKRYVETKILDKKVNEGRIYELYNYYKKKQRISFFEQRVKEVLADNLKAVRGGDIVEQIEKEYLQIQLKSFIGGAPPLISLNQIVDTFTKLLAVFEDFGKKEQKVLKGEIEKIFLDNHLLKGIEGEAKKEAQKFIDAKIKEIKGIDSLV